MTPLLMIILSLFFAAFFSGMETAFVSSSKLKIELDRKQEKFPSGIITIFTRYSEQYFFTMLVGYYIAMVVFGVTFTQWLIPLVTEHIPYMTGALAITIVAAGLVFFLFACYLPKILFRVSSNVIMNVCAVPTAVFFGVMYPITSMLHMFIRLFAKVAVFTKADMEDFVVGDEQPASKEEQDAEHEIKIFQNALDFSTVKIRNCMIPRTEIVAVEENTSIEELKQKFIDTGVSKIIICNEGVDNIIGYVHSKELFKNPQSIQSMINRLTFVPETDRKSVV